MGDINEVISVEVRGLGSVNDLAGALDKAAESAAKLSKSLAGIGGGGGADKLAESMDKAAASISGAVDKINGALDKVGASADSAASGLARLDEAAAAAGDSLGMAATGADEAAGASDRLAASADAGAAALDRQAVAGERAGASADAAAESQKKYHTLALAGAAAIGYGIYKAAQLQTQVTRLYTSAGESQKNLPMMTKGILGLSGQTATSQSQLAQGAYMIESAGFHGKDALSVLKAAAQGAQAEGAPLSEVGNALTSLMNSYGIKPGKATQAMNQIITMVGSGKMTMAGAVGALPAVLPVAAKAGLSFGQVGGALATMTQTGMSPDWAAQMLRHTIGSLQNPSNVQTQEMQQLGINSVGLSKNLGKEGLTGAIGTVEGAILHKMGPSGTVLLNSLNNSKLAAQSATQEIARMPSSLRSVATAYMDNATTSKAWKAELQALPPLQANLLKQFATTADAAHGFNNQLKAGGGSAQTFSAALSKAMGGTVGLQTALMLGGTHMSTFKANANAVSQAAKDAGTNVKGWSDIQKTFNFQLHSFQYGAEAAATTIGTALLPAATSAMKVLAGAGQFLVSHPAATQALTIGGGALGGAYALSKVAKPVTTGLQAVGKVAEVLKIPGLDKLANIGKGATGAAALDTSAANLSGAAAELSGAAAKLSGTGGIPGTAGKAAGAAGAGEAAAAGTAGETVGLSAGMLAAPVLGAGLGLALGIYLNKYKQGERPDVAGQLGPHAPAAGIGSQAWKQYDQVAAPAKSAVPMKFVAPMKFAAPDLSAFTQAKGKAAQAAAGIHAAAETPLRKPVKAAAPDLSAYTQAKGKAQVAGAQIDAGLAQGISSNAGAAVAAANSVASQVEAAMAHTLVIHSPSQKTKAIGAAAVQGLVVGLDGGQAAVNAAAAALGKNVAKAADIASIDSATSKLLSYHPADTALTKLLKADQTKLISLANQRAKLEAEITDSQQIATQAISSANITSAGSYTPALAASSGPLAADATISGMQSMAADQAQFAKVIGQLGKGGLNATSLNQFVQAGVSSLPAALGLAQGGKGAIGQVNSLEGQIRGSASKLGDAGGPAMYQAGVQASQGLAAGLKASLGSVEASMAKVASAMVADVKKGGGGTTVHSTTNVTINVAGSVQAEHDLATTVQNALLKSGNRNWQTGVILPGRRN